MIRASFRKRFGALLGNDAVLILPTMPDIAPLLSESDEALNDYRNNALNLLCLSVLSGLPQVSIPLASIRRAAGAVGHGACRIRYEPCCPGTQNR